MSFLSNLLRTSTAVAEAAANAKPVREGKQPNGDQAKGGETRSKPTRDKYAEVFSTPTPVSKGAAQMAVSHVGCLNQLYRYEKRGLVRRAGTAEDLPGRPILWEWCK